MEADQYTGFVPHANLAVGDSATGQHEKIIEESTEALRIDPTRIYPYLNLAMGYRELNRFGESKAVLERALAQKQDWVGIYGELYRLALQRGDTAFIQQ